MSFLDKIFSIKREKFHKKITILGISIKCQKKKDMMRSVLTDALDVVEKDIHTSYIHQKVFPKYKNINKGKTVVVCGAGPSLKKYKPIEGAIHVALNRAFLYEDVKFDYLFVQDWKGIFNISEEIAEYKGNNCIKFIGTQNNFEKEEIPESYVNSFECERFITDLHRWGFNGGIHKFTKHLETQPLGNFGTIAFPAMQFILYTNPEKIYIVGCDSAPVGHFAGPVLESNKRALNDNTYTKIVGQWKEFKEFADFHYPDIKIISVNPVGLTGLFEDVYTE